MIGVPVCTLARATARWIFSTFSVTPGASAAHFRNAALMSVPWMPRFDVLDEVVGHRVDVAVVEVVGEMVVGVDARARDDLHAGLLGDALHEAHVAPAEHRGRVDDRLHAVLLGGVDRHAAPRRARAARRSGPATAPPPPRRESARARARAPARAARRRSAPCTVSTFGIDLLRCRFSEAARPMRVSLAQLALQQLAAGVARQRLLAHGDVLRHLEVGEMLAAVPDHRRHVQLAAGARARSPRRPSRPSSRRAPPRPPPRPRRGRPRARFRPRSSRRSRRRG